MEPPYNEPSEPLYNEPKTMGSPGQSEDMPNCLPSPTLQASHQKLSGTQKFH